MTKLVKITKVQSEFALKNSFFDSRDIKDVFKFAQPEEKHQKDIDQQPSIKSSLTCKYLNTGHTKKGSYGLHNNLLVCYGDEQSKNSMTVLDLTHTRLKSIEGSSTSIGFGVKIAKNGGCFELQFATKQLLMDWQKVLRRICILETFHDDYFGAKLIGKGSFAKVFLVESRRNNKQYASKVISKDNPNFSNKNNARAALLNEIDILRELDHENIIKLYEVHETENSIYLIMELIQGKPLNEILKKQPMVERLSESKIMRIIKSLLEVLAYLASKGIMHRDLKPANILIDKKNNVKLIDFGLATHIDASDYIFKKCGTPGYMAPEVFRYVASDPATHYDDRCDVFSIGSLLFNLLFRYPLIDGNSLSETIEFNKNYSDIEVTMNIKRELNSPLGRINKDALTVLLDMIQGDQKRRITASTALTYKYFNPPSIPKFSSSFNMITNEPGSNNQIATGVSDPSINTPRAGRFIEKNSYYLDVGKSEFNGNISPIGSKTPINLSITQIKKGFVSDSLSGFAKNNIHNNRPKLSAKARFDANNNRKTSANDLSLNHLNMSNGSSHMMDSGDLDIGEFDHQPKLGKSQYADHDSSEIKELGEEKCHIGDNNIRVTHEVFGKQINKMKVLGQSHRICA